MKFYINGSIEWLKIEGNSEDKDKYWGKVRLSVFIW